MKKRIALFVGVALLAWLSGLAAGLPAARAIDWFAPEGVTAAGVSGTLWQGRAARIDTGGPAPVTGAVWDLSGWQLLRGRLAADTRFRFAGLEGSGYLASGGGRIDADGLTLRGPAAGLGDLLPRLPVEPAGQLLVRVEAATLADGRIERLEGRMQWSEAALSAPFDLDLGMVRASIEPAGNGDGYAIELDSEGGALDIGGVANLQPDGEYRLDLRLTPTASAPDGLRETLGLAAQREGDGFRVRRTGRLTLPGGG
ncbi:type II secretion system protein N [Halofilum ochraceum]|uniref:type II secretion system protein N n=1 Tax=Halofilum ochraceum TaxID=1611323 RepID=UPI0008D934DC|nr:type II secretion system protein N [Halofilum ochraceum]